MLIRVIFAMLSQWTYFQAKMPINAYAVQVPGMEDDQSALGKPVGSAIFSGEIK